MTRRSATACLLRQAGSGGGAADRYPEGLAPGGYQMVQSTGIMYRKFTVSCGKKAKKFT